MMNMIKTTLLLFILFQRVTALKYTTSNTSDLQKELATNVRSNYNISSNSNESRKLSSTYCGDDHFFTFHNNQKCSYILDKKSAATRRRLNLCKDANINNTCKWSCGHCSDSIVDDPHFKIVKYNGDEKPCQWIGEHKYWLTRQNRRNKFCPRFFDGRKVADACKLSCGNYDIPMHRQQRRKMGVIFNIHALHLKSYQHFENVASWTYNFQTTLPVNQGNFADEYGIEYVPMISQPYLLNKNCEFEVGICKSRFNEPYHKPYNYIDPTKAVYFWIQYVQPAAIENNLKLISPTTTWKDLIWLAEFLKACFDDPECDEDLIHAFNLHSYECEEHLWLTNHGGSPSKFEKDIISLIGTSWYGGKDWTKYFANRKVWVTETHCGHGPKPLDSSDEICRKITGQTHSDGRGSIIAMEELPTIERYAWWTTYNGNLSKHRYSNNYLTYEDGQLTPAGRGILDPANSGYVDCEFTGTRITADNAILSGEAKRFKCQSTGTYMIKTVGKNRGTATFEVNVAKTGKYAMNVSLMSSKQECRDLHVQINGGLIQTIPIWETVTKWCYEGGRPVVLPIELKSWFVASQTNTIKFGLVDPEKPTKLWDPIIEWIQVVPKEDE